MNHAELKAELTARGVHADVQARILRLNPEPIEPGVFLRGYRPSGRAGYVLRFQCGYFTKGEVIRRFGREAFDRIPRAFKRKNGRREYVTRKAVLDEVWRNG